jgi:starch synthase
LVLLEAMSLGTAVVATAAGGAEEVVVPGETGLLVPPRAPQALAAALEELLAQPARARALGAAGQERVRRSFTLEREAGQIVGTWERAAWGAA